MGSSYIFLFKVFKMADYKIYHKAATKQVRIQLAATAAPAGFTDLGTIAHDNGDDDVDDVLGIGENHILYHHVRDKLYTIGVENMQDLEIVVGAGSFVITPDFSVEAGQTRQLVATVFPANALVKDVTWAGNNNATGTVDPTTGVFTAVAAGGVLITATSTDTDAVGTVTITVTEP